MRYTSQNGHHQKVYKQMLERQMLYDIAYMQDLKKNDTNELIYQTETDSQT